MRLSFHKLVVKAIKNSQLGIVIVSMCVKLAYLNQFMARLETLFINNSNIC